MPLTSGHSRAVVSHNIAEMMHAGYPQRQAIAASLSNARRHPRADGGSVIDKAVSLAHQAARQRRPVSEDAKKEAPVVPQLADGGVPEIPYFARSAAHQIEYDTTHPGGLVDSFGAGRTDIHNVNVPAGSYVLPADVVSGLGEGNTLSGAKVIDQMLSTGPYGTRLPSLRGHSRYGSIPRPPAPYNDSGDAVAFNPRFADGGSAAGDDKLIPIVIAGGEYVVNPDQVAKIGGGNINRGHRILDAFVKHVRKKTVKTLRKLPGPVK